jgi:hypothetical protein
MPEWVVRAARDHADIWRHIRRAEELCRAFAPQNTRRRCPSSRSGNKVSGTVCWPVVAGPVEDRHPRVGTVEHVVDQAAACGSSWSSRGLPESWKPILPGYFSKITRSSPNM